MLAVDAANPAAETPPVRSADSMGRSSSENGGGSGDGSGSSGDDSDAGSSNPRRAVLDRQGSPSVLSLSRLPSWGSWGSISGVGGSIAEEGSEAGEAAADHGPPYHCQICLDDRPAQAGFLLSACGHTFCRACLKAYVTSKVNDAEVYPTCFHVTEGFHTVGGGDDGSAGHDNDDDDAAVAAENGRDRVTRGSELGRGEPGGGGDGRGRARPREKPEGCGVVLGPSDIKELLRADGVASRKYARFLFFREHKTARECPKCDKLSVGDPSVTLEMRCDGCGAVFCYEHGGAHEGRSCAEHVESTADETDRTMALIGRMTKPCPGCGTPVEKLGGCNQMVCLHCNSSFCWICMEEVDRGTFPVHFQWWNVRGCPNQQLQEDAAHQSTSGRQCLQALSVLQIIVVGPFALLMTVVSSLACFCCLPAFKLSPRELFTGCISGWGNFVMVLPLIPLVCASAVLAGVVYVIMLPFRLSTAIHRKWRFGRSGLSLPGSRGHGVNRARSSSSGGGGGGDDSGGASSISGRQVPPSAGGRMASSHGAVGAADVDVGTTNGVAVTPSTSSVAAPPAAAAARALADVLLGRERGPEPQVPLGWREERQRQRQQQEGRRWGQEGERVAEGGLRLQHYPYSPPSPPPIQPSKVDGGGGGALGGGAVALPSLPKESLTSPVSRHIASPPLLAPSSEVAMPGGLGNSGWGSEGSGSSGSGGGDDGDGQMAAPFASLGVRHMLGRLLGVSPSPSPAAAVGAAVPGAAGATAAAAAEAGVPSTRHRGNKAGPADEEEGDNGEEVPGCLTAEGGVFNTTVYSLFALPGDEEPPRPLAAATARNGPITDGRDDIV